VPAPCMPRCPAVLLTPPHSIPSSSLLLALPALSLEGSREGFTLLQKRKRYPLFLQSLPHSCSKTPGIHTTALFNFRRFFALHGSRSTFHGSRSRNSFSRNTYKKWGRAAMPADTFPHPIQPEYGFHYGNRRHPSGLLLLALRRRVLLALAVRVVTRLRHLLPVVRPVHAEMDALGVPATAPGDFLLGSHGEITLSLMDSRNISRRARLQVASSAFRPTLAGPPEPLRSGHGNFLMPPRSHWRTTCSPLLVRPCAHENSLRFRSHSPV
jgi:hypothetical protein